MLRAQETPLTLPSQLFPWDSDPCLKTSDPHPLPLDPELQTTSSKL